MALKHFSDHKRNRIDLQRWVMMTYISDTAWEVRTWTIFYSVENFANKKKIVWNDKVNSYRNHLNN